MDYSGINSMMKQQLGAVKELEELLDFDGKQNSSHGISKEDIGLLKDHVDHLKKICNTATALSQHYRGLEKKAESKITPAPDVDIDESDYDETTVHPLEGTLKKVFDEAVKEPPKEKKTRIRKPTAPKVEPDPVEEDGDLDDLLS